MSKQNKMRVFPSGGTRDGIVGKIDIEGFLDPKNLEIFGQYMHKHRKQSDGKTRASDNWTKGFGLDVCIKSGQRHNLDWWLLHRGYPAREDMNSAICGLIFNAFAYLREYNKHE